MRSPLVLQYYARYVDIIVTIVIGLINHMALVSSPPSELDAKSS